MWNGTIFNIAKNIAKVIGVDIVESAIEDAKISAQRNKSSNIEFFAADVGKFLLDYPGIEEKSEH